jgi:hypothetical protein
VREGFFLQMRLGEVEVVKTGSLIEIFSSGEGVVTSELDVVANLMR